jgi:uncharacterized membrane protein (UPF0127 family)
MAGWAQLGRFGFDLRLIKLDRAKAAEHMPRKREGRTARLRSAFGVGLIACLSTLGLATSPVLADGTDPGYPGSVLHVKATGTLTPSSVLTITATGTNVAPQSVDGIAPFSFGLRLFLVSYDRLPVPCATTFGRESAISNNNIQAAKLLTYGSLSEGNSGPFRISLPVTLNNGTGTLLICAYTLYGDSDDAAWASTEVTITRGGGKPSQFAFRRVTLGATSGCWPLATTPSQRAQGLRGVLHPALPMVFIFQKPGSYAFTMTGTPAPLIGVWIGVANTVIGHWHGTPDSTTPHTAPMPITKAVLYPVGWRTPSAGARLRLGARCRSSGKL